jgi:ACS family hexuronate transporter-like MFS transporter
MLLVAACIMPVSILAVHVGSAYVAIGLIAVLLAAQSCWMANILTMMSETFPREHLATYAAVAGLGGSLGGIVTNLLAGQIIHVAGYVPVFTGLGVLHLIAFFFLRSGSRRGPASAGWNAQPTALSSR